MKYPGYIACFTGGVLIGYYPIGLQLLGVFLLTTGLILTFNPEAKND